MNVTRKPGSDKTERFIGHTLGLSQFVFTPWQNVARIIWALPMVYATWRKRNIYLSMTVYVLSIIAGMLLLLVTLFGAGSD